MNRWTIRSLLAGVSVCALSIAIADNDRPDSTLKVVIIRHGEKPDQGHNLSCKGMNRALKLPKVLYDKFQKPAHTYVPALDCGKSTGHSRMFQTVAPFAIKYDLEINSKFEATDYDDIAHDVLDKKGTVLMVWEHSGIQKLAKALKVNNPPEWEDTEFDKIWIITYANGQAKLTYDTEGITPVNDCSL